MSFRRSAFVALILVASVLVGRGFANLASSSSPRPTGELAVSSNPAVPATGAEADFVGAVDLVTNAGAKGSFVSWTWRTLEPAPRAYRLREMNDSLAYLGTGRRFDLLVGLQVINTTAKEVPPDLAAVAFDAEAMKARFHALVNAVRPFLTRRVRYLSIGNEVDVYLAAHPQEWDAYTRFYQDAVAYMHTTAPWIRVGVTVTFDGAFQHKAQVAALTSRSSVLILTYYPLGARFSPLGPDAPLTDIPTMVELAGKGPLVLQEVGYPSASTLASSELQQAQFVTAIFRAWTPQMARIPFMNFFLLHDLPASTCAQLASYYGLPRDQNFQAFLCSLGLRHADGRPKPGWSALVKAAGAAGLR